jgi:hypothetical protein
VRCGANGLESVEFDSLVTAPSGAAVKCPWETPASHPSVKANLRTRDGLGDASRSVNDGPMSIIPPFFKTR